MMDAEPLSYLYLDAIEITLKYFEANEGQLDPREHFGNTEVRKLLEEIKRLRRMVGEPYPGMDKDKQE